MTARYVPPLDAPIFVDASGWLAALNRRDPWHAVARPVIDVCRTRRIPLVTTNWTAYEALSMLKSRVGPDLVSELWELLVHSSAVTFVSVSEDLERSALELFFRYGDKTWGVVDCASLVVMEAVGCRQALAFDRHFVEASRQRGFEVLMGSP